MSRGIQRLVSLLRQKYRRDGLVSLLAYAFWFPLLGLLVTATGNQIECQGITLRLDGPRIDLGTKGLLADCTYERAEVAAVDRYLPAEVDVIELGGGIGYLTCYVNRLLDAGVEHVVLEPDPEAARVLERNIAINGCDVRVDNRAYSPGGASVEFYRHGSFKMGGLHRWSAHSMTVDGIDLDSVCEAYDLGPFTLIADIEGAEAELIEAELDVLEDCCGLVIVEFHSEYVENAPAVERARHRLEASSFERIDEIDTVSVYRNTTLGRDSAGVHPAS